MIEVLKNFFSILSNKQKIFFYKLQILIVLASLLEIISIGGLAFYFSMILDINNLILKIKSFEFLSIHSNDEIITLFGILLIFTFFISSLLNIISVKFQYSFTENIGADFSQRLYNFYLSQNYIYFVNNDINLILKKITADIQRFTDQFLASLVILLSKIAICLMIFTILLIYNFKITLTVFFIILGFYLIIRKIFKKKIDISGKQITFKLSQVYDYVSSSLSGIREVIFYSRKNFLKQNLRNNLNELARNKSFLKTIGNVPRFFIEFISFSVLIVFIIFFSNINTSLDSIIFNLAIFGSAGYKLLPAMQSIYYALNDLYGHKNSFESIYPELLIDKNKNEILKTQQSTKDEISEISRIDLQNVSFAYKKKLNLETINVEFKKNQKIGIVGKSGSGKSTLLDLILGFIEPNSGSIAINGKELSRLNIENYRNCIGFVPQNIFLFNDSISKNITLDKSEDKDLIKEITKICLLDEFISRNDIKISIDKVGNYGKMMSGGQKQRIGIARALYNKPKLLILDEATNALDNITQNKIISNIFEFTEVNIVVLITHNTNLLRDFDKIFLLNDGKIVSEGSYQELTKKNELFQRLKNYHDQK